MFFFKRKEKVITETYSQYGIPGHYFITANCRLKIIIDPPREYFGKKLRKDRADFDKLLLIHGAETPDINNVQREILEHGNQFDKICSFDPVIINAFKQAQLFCFGSCWVLTDDKGKVTALEKDYHPHFKLKDKLKLSFIRSTKKALPGHKLRYELEDTILKERPYELYFPKERIETKLPLFEDSMYHLTIENSRYTNYITEKVIDCFMSYTVPIYWGCPNIGSYFDTRGIITFETKEELEHILQNLNTEFYHQNSDAIKHNYEVAKNEFAFFFDRINAIIKTL